MLLLIWIRGPNINIMHLLLPVHGVDIPSPPWEGGQVLEWAVQGGGGVTDPGGIQETFRFYTEGHGLVGSTGDRWMVGLSDLGGLFQHPSDSVIL